MDDNQTAKPRWLRFSITNLLLLTTCLGVTLGLGIALLRSQEMAELHRRRAGLLHDENRRLRKEYGEFNVADPSLFYGAQINRHETSSSRMLDWKWRVYLPKESTLRFADGGISKKGLPKSDLHESLMPGYYTIRLRYWPGLSSRETDWLVEVVIQNRVMNRTLVHHATDPRWPVPLGTPADKWPRASPVEGIHWGMATVRSDHSQQPNQPIVLQRLLVQPGDPPKKPSNNDVYWVDTLGKKELLPGFVIWLEPKR